MQVNEGWIIYIGQQEFLLIYDCYAVDYAPNQEYQRCDGAVEGGYPEGDSTRSLVP